MDCRTSTLVERRNSLEIITLNKLIMKLNKILVNSIVATVLSLNLQAKVTMPAIFTDGMVLQQESKVPIWQGGSAMGSQRQCA